jgi:ABC-type polar amino acid transport system ATPase subunit
MIRINQITKSYEGTRALDNVSLEIGRNEVVSIIGYSGSGKSTLIKCIAGLEPFESGSIVTDIKPRNGYNGIGMVFSRSNLFPHLTILQNLMLAPVKVLGRPKEEVEDEAIQLLDKVGIWAAKDSYPDSLSSGQRQRAAVARSLMMHPEILLLDEPTSSLDPLSAREVFNVLTTLKDQMTIVLVTHNIDFARSVSDRIVFMSNGKICEEGTPSEIIDHPRERQTRAYINHCMNMVYEITSPKYDHPELNARIEVFCMRYRLPFSDT